MVLGILCNPANTNLNNNIYLFTAQNRLYRWRTCFEARKKKSKQLPIQLFDVTGMRCIVENIGVMPINDTVGVFIPVCSVIGRCPMLFLYSFLLFYLLIYWVCCSKTPRFLSITPYQTTPHHSRARPDHTDRDNDFCGMA